MASYNGAVSHDPPAAAVADALGRLVAEALGQGATLTVDPRLHGPARTLAAAPGLDRLPGSALATVLQAHGVPEPQARLLAVDLSPAAPEAALDDLLARVRATLATGTFNRVGGALAPTRAGRARLVVLLLRSHVAFAPVPRRPVRGASVLLRGQVAPGFVWPAVVITRPDGATRRPAVAAATDGSFHAVVPLGAGDGVYQVEILARSVTGPEVLAILPLHVGTEPPTRLALGRGAVAPVPTPAAAAAALFERLNQARRAAGLGALAWDPALAAVAESHARELCSADEVRHHSAETGTVQDRVRQAGITAAWVAETVGHAEGVDEVHRSLLASPAHRAARLRAGLTHAGVGACVVRSAGGRPRLYVTEVLVSR